MGTIVQKMLEYFRRTNNMFTHTSRRKTMSQQKTGTYRISEKMKCNFCVKTAIKILVI